MPTYIPSSFFVSNFHDLASDGVFPGAAQASKSPKANLCDTSKSVVSPVMICSGDLPSAFLLFGARFLQSIKNSIAKSQQLAFNHSCECSVTEVPAIIVCTSLSTAFCQ
jgi:hypothetical protein